MTESAAMERRVEDGACAPTSPFGTATPSSRATTLGLNASEWLKERRGQRTLALATPADALRADERQLRRIVVEPHERLLRFSVRSDDLVLSDDDGEIARVLGGSVANLAASPQTTNGIPTHFHLDPRYFPEVWAEDSLAEVLLSYESPARG